jgi:hypothetical protein
LGVTYTTNFSQHPIQVWHAQQRQLCGSQRLRANNVFQVIKLELKNGYHDYDD